MVRRYAAIVGADLAHAHESVGPGDKFRLTRSRIDSRDDRNLGIVTTYPEM